MLRKVLKTYVLVAPLLFGIDWFVGVARFYWPVFGRVFTVINFPWSIPTLWIEKQPSIWWHGHFGGFIDDEIGQGISFLLMVALQAVFLTILLSLSQRWRTQKQSKTIVGG